MNSMFDRDARLRELYCDAALVGLDAAEQAQLAQLLAETGRRPGSPEEQSYERVVIAIALAGAASRPEPMSPALAEKVAMRAFEVMSSPMSAPMSGPMGPPRSAPVVQLSSRRFRTVAIVGWIAAAACLLLAVGAIVKRPREVVVTNTVVVPASAPTMIAPPPRERPEAQRQALLARPGTVKMEWAATKDPASKVATGDVVWNAKEQTGFMTFRGLAKNDPGSLQYQLWIFDKSRDARYPVDGGVFDIDNETGDVVVAFHGRVPVGDANLFAVTVEKPGGVVVSKRERIVLTAKPAV